MIGKLVDHRQEQERLERRAVRLLNRAQQAAEKAHRREATVAIRPIDLGLRIPRVSSKPPSRGAGWNRGQRMWSPSISERCRRVEGLLRYISAPETHSLGAVSSRVEKCTYWNSTNFRLGTSIDAHIDEMSAVAAMVERGGDPIAHVILSHLPGEQPTEKQVDEAVAIFLQEAKFEKCRAVWAVHDDRDHVHIHVVVNRVDAVTRRMCRWGGNGGWSHDVLGRTVARIDALQGWTSARNARFTVEGDRVVPTRRTKGERGISQRARRYEIETGDASAERRARAAAARIDLDRITSWEDFHRQAQAAGLRFEKSGRGLVVDIAGERIKASQVGRVFSLGRLETRFGDFRTTDHGGTVPLGSSSLVPDDLKGLQKDVLEIRDEFKSRRGALRRRHAEEKTALAEKQKAEREDSTKGRDFRGRGSLLNDLRAELARRHREERSILVERHAREREEVSGASTGPLSLTPFLSGGAEKRAHDQNRVRHYLDDRMIEIAPTSKPARIDRSLESRLPALRPFVIAGHRGDVVEWCRGEIEDPASLFVEDDGDLIRVPQTHDQAVLLAAMTLADHRGSPIALNIPDDLRRDFEDKIVTLAAAHGIPLVDDRLEKRRDDLVVDWTLRAELDLPRQHLFDEIHAAVGADAYAITVKKIGHEDGHGYDWLRREIGLDHVPPQVARACLATISKAKGVVPFLTPISHDRHLLVADRRTLEEVDRHDRQGGRPSLRMWDPDLNVVVVSAVDVLGASRHVQAAACDRVASRLFGRDSNLQAAAIPLDPTRYKILASDASRTCPLATKIFEEEVRKIEVARSREVERRLAAIPDPKILLAEDTTIDVDAARRLSIYATHTRHIVTGVTRPLDGAVVDRLVARRLTACGFAESEAAAVISAGSPRLPEDRSEAEKYLARTLSAARLSGELDRHRAQLRAPTWAVITTRAEDAVPKPFTPSKAAFDEQTLTPAPIKQALPAAPPPTSTAIDRDEKTISVTRSTERPISETPAPIIIPRREDPPPPPLRRAVDPLPKVTPFSGQPSTPPPHTTTPAWTMPSEVDTWLSSLVKKPRQPTVEPAIVARQQSETVLPGPMFIKRRRTLALLSEDPEPPACERSKAELALDRLETIIARDVHDFERLDELKERIDGSSDENSPEVAEARQERRQILDLRQIEVGPERRSPGLYSDLSSDLAYEFIWADDATKDEFGRRLPPVGTAVAGIYEIFGDVLMARDESHSVLHGADARDALDRRPWRVCRFFVTTTDVLAHAKGLVDPEPFADLFEQALIESSKIRKDIVDARRARDQAATRPAPANPKRAKRPKSRGIGD